MLFVWAEPGSAPGVGFALSGFLGRSGLVGLEDFVFLQGSIPAFSSLSGAVLPEPALTASLSCSPVSLCKHGGLSPVSLRGPGLGRA